jgi:hypothetical protein
MGQGIPALVAVLIPVPALYSLSQPNRRLTAIAPGLVAAAVFVVTCIASGLIAGRSADLAGYLPLAAMAVVLLLLVPSTLALRYRWGGLLHLLTGAGTLFLWLVSTMAISHDWL